MVSRLPDSSTDTADAPEPRPRRRFSRGRRAALKTIAVLPTMCTLGNLLCGFLAIFLASRPHDTALPFGWSPVTFAVLAVFAGMFLDALDGRIARLTGQTSELGEQLDSMADMVTFGVAPAFIAMMVVKIQVPFLAEGRADQYIDRVALVAAGIYVACAALRLARFNIETQSPEIKDHMSFKGLPSPGAAGTVASLILLHEHFLAPLTRQHEAVGIDTPLPEPWALWLSKIGMIVIMLLVAFAMVSRLRYAHVTNRYVRGRASFNFIVVAVVFVLLMAVALQYTIAAGMVLYALSAPVAWLWYKLFGKRGESEQMMVPDDEDDEDENVTKADEETAGGEAT